MEHQKTATRICAGHHFKSVNATKSHAFSLETWLNITGLKRTDVLQVGWMVTANPFSKIESDLLIFFFTNRRNTMLKATEPYM